MSSDGDDSTAPPSDAMMKLLAPDGYYLYLGIPKVESGGTVDADLIKKNYRKLSLKHHPDRNGGDAGTFRMLHRAQKVLTNAKLRKQYDILGIDLDDDDEHAADGDKDGDDGASGGGDQPSTSEGIVREIASMALTTVLQFAVKTAMMAVVALLVVRYFWTLLPAMAFLAFIAYKIKSSPASSMIEVTSPFIIGTGLVLMYLSYNSEGWFIFWMGESLTIGMFTLNSLAAVPKSTPVIAAVSIFSSLCALCLRGKFWNYATVLGLELFLAIFIALAFPIMEMALEAILNDKLKKVGEKVRAHHQHLERYYQAKQSKR